MKPMVSPAQLREMETRSGQTESEMVARAGECLWHAISDYRPRRVRFLCGPGNNGADGYAAACLAQKNGVHTDIRAVYPPRTPACRQYADAARPDGFNGTPDLWVDALFGSGARLTEDTSLSRLRDEMSSAPVIAADVPSGLDAAWGAAAPWAFSADVTVTMGCLKPGLFFGAGPDLCGKIVIAGLNLPIPAHTPLLMEDGDAAVCYPPRRHDAHKNTYGHLLILAGSEGMAGAASLCARAAVRGGSGLVTVACPRCVLPVVQSLCPEAMCRPLEDCDFSSLLAGKTAVAAGPGYVGSKSFIWDILQSELPAVLDAGALSILAAERSLLPLLNRHHVITPHPGEARRLLPGLPADPLAAAALLANPGCTAVYKGAATVIAGKATIVSASGCPGMAKGGSGDALTGLIGALLAQGYDPELAARCADHVHGLAGELAEKKYGDVSMTAADLIDHVPQAIRIVRESAENNSVSKNSPQSLSGGI